MSYLGYMPFMAAAWDAMKRGKPRPCAYEIVSWEAVTGQIMGICDPVSNMMLDPNEMVITAQWPWNAGEEGGQDV